MSSTNEVLVVDDNPNVLFVACKRLQAMGFDTVAANDGAEALSLMDAHPRCRRMITDFTMPGLGGAEWIEHLQRKCRDWTIVVISAADVDPGPFINVPKPVDYELLMWLFNAANK